MNAVAGDVIDIYGERNKETDKVIMRHAKDIREIELYLNQQMKNENLNLDSPEFKDMFVKKILITEKIRRELGYLYVNFDTIYYPDHKNIYTTVEVISKKTPERLQFLSVEASPESQEKHSKRSWRPGRKHES